MPRRCKVCKERYKPKYTSLQSTCNNISCVITFGKKQQDKARKESDKAFRQKVVIEDVQYQHKLTQKIYNQMRVLEELKWFADEGIEPYCISCLKTKMDWCCGHFKTVGSQGNLRYDEMNTYLQCNRYCNMGLSGNIEGNKTSIGYKSGLKARFGPEEGRLIIDYCETNTDPRKWNWLELKEFRAECSARIRQLSKQIE